MMNPHTAIPRVSPRRSKSSPARNPSLTRIRRLVLRACHQPKTQCPRRGWSVPPLPQGFLARPWRQAIAYGYQKSNQRGRAFTDVWAIQPPLGPAAPAHAAHHGAGAAGRRRRRADPLYAGKLIDAVAPGATGRRAGLARGHDGILAAGRVGPGRHAAPGRVLASSASRCA